MRPKTIFKMLIFIIGISMSAFTDAGFFGESAQGWHWYNEPEPHSQELEDTKLTPAAMVHRTPTEILEGYRKELEARLHMAWLNPSPQNVQAYHEMQRDLMNRAQNFSQTWMQVVYNNPHLDNTLITPVNHKARHLYLDQQRHEIVATIKGLSQEYGLFFFFDSQCEYCHRFAPIVRSFSEVYGWEVMAISVDGGPIKGFKNQANDNGFQQRWKVEVLPALFAVNPNTGHVIPVAYGVASLDEMETRIMALSKMEKL